jgi:hypothetical protein
MPLGYRNGRRRYHVDGWIDPSTGCWDGVVDRQPLNRRRPLEAQFPLAKEEKRAKLSLASTPASPQTRPLESWSSAPPRVRRSANQLLASSHAQRASCQSKRYPRVTTGYPWCDQISTPAETQLRITVPSTDTVPLRLFLVSTNRHDADRSPLPERRGNNARQPTNDRKQA